MKNAFLLLELSSVFLLFCQCTSSSQGPVKVERDGVYISYTINGNADTTLLFIPGWCIDKSYWQQQVDHFSKRYKVVTMDLPGFGASGTNRADWSIPAYGQDVVALIHALQLGNVILVGHSMSADIAIEAASRDPHKVIGVVGINNFQKVGVPYTPLQKKEIGAFLKELKRNFDTTTEAYARQSFFLPGADSSEVQRVLEDFRYANKDIAVSALQSYIGYRDTEPQTLRQLPCELFLLNSDPGPTAEDGLERYCAHSFEVVPIPTSGHYPMLEQPATFDSLLEHVLDRIGHQQPATPFSNQ